MVHRQTWDEKGLEKEILNLQPVYYGQCNFSKVIEYNIFTLAVNILDNSGKDFTQRF